MRNLILLLSFFSALSLQAQSINQTAIQKQYNDLYTQVLFEKKYWPDQLEKQKLNFDQTQDQYQSSVNLLNDSLNQIQILESDLETQKMHLDFLKQVEPRSLVEKEKLKQNLVNSGEFSDATQVTLNSLSQKADQLDQEALFKQNEVDQNYQKIENLKYSDQYQGYLQQRNRLKDQKAQKNSDINDVKRRIDNLLSKQGQLKRDLRSSERAEEQAKVRLVKIKQRKIPELKRENNSLKTEIRSLSQKNKNKKQKRDQVTSKRNQTKSKIQNKQNKLKKPKADKKALKAEIKKLKTQLRNQNQRIQRLTSEIRSTRQKISRLESRQERNSREIRSLKDEVIRKERKIANEDIRQIRLKGDIRETSRKVANLENQESGLFADLNYIDGQLNSVQSQINQYISTHIAPIEQTINQLENEKQQLSSRSQKLLQTKTDLLTEDQNVLVAKNKIPGQESLILERETNLTQKKQAISQLQNQTQSLQHALEQEKQTYNNLISNIENKKLELKALAQQVMESIELQKNGGN